MDNAAHYACIDRFYEDYFQQKIISKRLVSKHNPHNRILEFATGHKWVSKVIPRQNWTGMKRCREDIEYTEYISSKVSLYLKATVTAMRWGEGHAVVPYFKDWHLLFPFVEGASIKQCQSLHAFELGKLLALIHQLPLSRERASVFPKLRASCHHPAFIQQDICLCNEAYLYRLDEFVVSHRDLHAGNIMWSMQNKPILVDWESTGFIHPFVDLIGLAVNSASISQLQFNDEHFKSALRGYRAVQDTLPPADTPLWQQCFHSWLLWLNHNYLIHHEKEVQNTLKIIKYLHKIMPAMKAHYNKLSLAL